MKKVLAVMLALLLALSMVSALAAVELTGDELAVERWFDLNSDMIITFEALGGYSIESGHRRSSSSWRLKNGQIHLSKMDLTPTDSEYGLSLVADGCVFVRESMYPRQTANPGESLSTDSLSARVESVDFLERWPDEIISGMSGSVQERAVISDSQCLARVSVTLMNLSKSDILMSEGKDNNIQIAIDYREGFIYSTNGPIVYYVSDGLNWCLYVDETKGRYTHGTVTVAPLEEKKIDFYIPCPKILGSDTESALKIIVDETVSGKRSLLDFVVRGDAAAPAEEPAGEVQAEEAEMPDEAAEEPGEEVHEIGETVTTDIVEFTLQGFQFGHLLSTEPDDTFHLPTNANRGLVAGDGEVYVIFDFYVKNISKEKISGRDICGMDSKYNKSTLWQIDYNGGYIYDNGDYASLELARIAGNFNYSPSLKPLETVAFRGIIKCVDVVETDAEAPLLLRVSLPASGGQAEFVYKLDRDAGKTGEDAEVEAAADTQEVYTDKGTVKAVQQALNDAGYNCGTPDGAAGKKTKAAIKNYQSDKGLTVTGTITNELLVSLGIKN